MKITKYPQSCILIEDYKGKNILFDPGTYVYEQSDITPDYWKNIDILLLTHKPGDHTDPEAIKVIIENNNPIILTNDEVQAYLKENGIESEVITEKEIENIKIKAITSLHGDLSKFGKETPKNTAFLIDDKILHLGDTMTIDEKPYADIILIPISDVAAMDAKKAAEFVNEVKPKLAIPIHYSNPNLPGQPEDFVKAMEGSDIKYKILENKESIEVE
ncbi:MAG: MBL fold metallo-hydrolase [Candidatus Woesearchaeota archaeon]